MSDALYREQILEHWRNPRNFGELANATHKAFENNQLCGDEIGIALHVKGGIVQDVRFHGAGCAISMAATSLLTEVLHGKNVDDIKKIKKEDVFDLLGVVPSASRVECALLGWSVLQKVL